MPEHRREHPVGIVRVDQQRRDLLAVAQPEVLPGLAAVRRLVDAVAHRQVGALQPFAAAGVDHPRVRRRHRERADRLRRLRVEQRPPGPARVVGLPDAAVVDAHVEHVGLSRHPHRRHRPSPPERPDQPPAQLREQGWIDPATALVATAPVGGGGRQRIGCDRGPGRQAGRRGRSSRRGCGGQGGDRQTRRRGLGSRSDLQKVRP